MSRSTVFTCVMLAACGRVNIPSNADNTPNKNLTPAARDGQSLSVQLPKEALAPGASFTLVYSEPVKSKVAVSLRMGETVLETSFEWSGDKRLLSVRPKKALPRGAEVRLQVKGAKNISGVAFADVDEALRTKVNPQLRLLTRASSSATPEVVFTTFDEAGERSFALKVEGDASEPSQGEAKSCTHFLRKGSVEEALTFVAPGRDGALCSADDEALSAYEYREVQDSRVLAGTSLGLGADETARTADDESASYTVATHGPGAVTSCQITGAGDDGLFLSDDDATTCTCAIDEPKAPEGFARRVWTSADTCSIAAGTSYCNDTETADGETSVRTTKCYHALEPGVAKADDQLLSTIVAHFDAFGQELVVETTAAETVSRVITSYDEEGNLLERTTRLAGADKAWETSDDYTASVESFDASR